MKAAYVGTLTPGSTSRMRAECLRSITPGWTWEWVDTDSAIIGSARVWQSAAYRLKAGPAVRKVNALVGSAVGDARFDLIWVDKAVFLWPSTVRQLRSAARRLVHFTPDAAFHTGNSRFFERTIRLYDLLVTTKSYEIAEYRSRAEGTALLTTQGYDAGVHYPRNPHAARERSVAFVGLVEEERERCLSVLLGNGIDVTIAGKGWGRFLSHHRRSPHLSFAGEGVFGEEYASLLSRSWVGLGLVSKRFPELHTTRTFEIPACGAILATERNEDTLRFFAGDEAIFFGDHRELAESIATLFAGAADEELRTRAEAGRRRVARDGRSYADILRGILADPRLAP